MAGFSALGLGLLLGAGVGGAALAARRTSGNRSDNPYNQPNDPRAGQRTIAARQQSGTLLGGTTAPPPVTPSVPTPPDPGVAAATNADSARQVAMRQRRRAMAGSAGRASTGASQAGVASVAASPRSLLGY